MKSIFLSLVLALLLCLGTSNVRGQHLDAGLTGGVSFYQGDLAESNLKAIFNSVHPAGGVFVRYNINQLLAVRLQGTYLHVSGDDADSSTEIIRRRNLSFNSDIYEGSLLLEWNITGYQPYALFRPFSPYLFVGGSFYAFDPKTEFGDEVVALQPLGTEGQSASERYRLSQIAIPLGLGVKWAPNDRWTLGLEVGARLSRTDYLDDVSGNYPDLAQVALQNGQLAAELSYRTDELDPDAVPPLVGTQRGSHTGNDLYYYTGIMISYNFLDTGLSGARSRNRNKKNCYGF